MIASYLKERAAEVSGTWAHFLDFVERSPDLLRPMDIANVRCDYPVQSWPTFVSPATYGQIALATTSVFRLLRTIPSKIFGNDAAKIGDFYRILPARLAPGLLMEPNGVDIAIGRGDFIDSDMGFQCVELYPLASVGGLETEFMFDAYLH